MAHPAFLPKPAEISREALIVIAGALVAAFVIGQFPSVRQWIKDQWSDAPHPTPAN